MRPKILVYASLLTLGAIPVLMWAWRKIRHIQLDPVSDEWLSQANIVEIDPYIY